MNQVDIMPINIEIAARILATRFFSTQQTQLDEEKRTLRSKFYESFANYSTTEQLQIIRNATQYFNDEHPKRKAVFVSGVAVYLRNELAYFFENLSDAGWIKITDIGDENVYFIFKSDCGQELNGYCKCL